MSNFRRQKCLQSIKNEAGIDNGMKDHKCVNKKKQKT